MKRQSKRGSRSKELFTESAPKKHATSDAYIANIDGAARGNPGPAACAVILRRPDGNVVARLTKRLGRATNNLAEYSALLAALDYVQAHNIGALHVRSDSELLVRQMLGVYRMKNPQLRPLYEQAHKLAQGLAHFSIEYIPREQNRETDALVNAALDEAAGRTWGDKSVPATRKDETPSSKLESRRIRARYCHGALYPAEPLDLAEGEEVELAFRTLRDKE